MIKNSIIKTITLALALVITVLTVNPITALAENTYDIDTLAGSNFGLLGSAAKTPCDSSNLKYGETYKLIKTSGAWSQENGASYATRLRGYFFQIQDLEGNVVGHAYCGNGALNAPSDCEFTIGEDTEEVTDQTIKKVLANAWGGCPDLMGKSYFSLKGNDNNAQAYVLVHSYLHNLNNTTKALTDEDKVVISIAEDIVANLPEIPSTCEGKAIYYQENESTQPIYIWIEESEPSKEANANVTLAYDPVTKTTNVGGVITDDQTDYNTAPNLDGYTLYDTSIVYSRFRESLPLTTIQNNLDQALAHKVGTDSISVVHHGVHSGTKNFGAYMALNTDAYTFGASYVPYISQIMPSKISTYTINSPEEGLLKAFEQTKKNNLSNDGVTITGLRTSIGSEIYVKDHNVNYFVYEINIANNDNTITVDSNLTNSGSYSILKNDMLVKGYGNAMIVVDNAAGDTANLEAINKLVSAYQTPTSNPLGVAQELFGTNHAFSPCTVGIGYSAYENEFRGYTIILVKYIDNVSRDTEGRLTLHQEELNHWYNDMIANSASELGQEHTWRLQLSNNVWSYTLTESIKHTDYVLVEHTTDTTEEDTDEENSDEEDTDEEQEPEYKPVDSYHYNYNTKNYNIVVTDKTTGPEANEDSNSWYYSAAGNGTINTSRVALANGVTYDMSQFNGVLTTYRFNQVRAFSGDIRTISSITGTGTNGGEYLAYSQSVLKCRLGATWNGSMPADFTETLKMEAVSSVTGNLTRYNVHSINTCGQSHSWYSLSAANSFSPFLHNGDNSTKFTHTITCKTLKYNAQNRNKGYAKVGDTVINGIAKEFYNTGKATYTNIANFANFGIIKDNEISVKYLTEVPMTEERLNNGTINKYLAMTMSEKYRNTELSSLYFMHIQKSNRPVTGVTYSETALTGIKNSDGYTYVTNGAGITLKSDCDFTMNFYGYALDMISASDDITMVTPSYNNDGIIQGTISTNYTDIIHDNTNVRSVWGNANSNAVTLKSHFADWVSELTNPKLYGVDATLKIENGNTYSGFSASFGNLSSIESLESEYTFPITIVKGSIVKDTIYRNLIWQIANDNECTYDEAESLFVNSGIMSSITEAIESSIDSDNNSDSPRNGGVGYWYYNKKTGDTANISYNENHWYDECVKTFVIRRYKQQGFRFSDITLSDKIDINETSYSTTKLDNQGRMAKWYLNIYYTKSFNGASFTDAQCYNPNAIYELAGKATIDQAAQYGSLLVYNAHIENSTNDMKADFKLQSSTTVNDFDF